jgi:hypothetical protein
MASNNSLDGTVITIPDPDPVLEFSPFSTTELRNMKAFMEEHGECYHNSDNGRTEFHIRTGATGIGFQTFIKCACCGVEKDVTDYDIW